MLKSLRYSPGETLIVSQFFRKSLHHSLRKNVFFPGIFLKGLRHVARESAIVSQFFAKGLRHRLRTSAIVSQFFAKGLRHRPRKNVVLLPTFFLYVKRFSRALRSGMRLSGGGLCRASLFASQFFIGLQARTGLEQHTGSCVGYSVQGLHYTSRPSLGLVFSQVPKRSSVFSSQELLSREVSLLPSSFGFSSVSLVWLEKFWFQPVLVQTGWFTLLRWFTLLLVGLHFSRL